MPAAARASRQEGSQEFAGPVKFLQAPTVPAGSFGDADIEDDAGVAADKLRHQHRISYRQSNSSAASDRQVIYICIGAAGEIIGISAGSIAIAVGAATVTVDIKRTRAGVTTSVLSAVITLDSGNTALLPEHGTLSGTPANLLLQADDVLEIDVVATAGGGTLPTGVFASVTVEEDAR